MNRPVAMVVMGTRPEVIKLAPVVEALARSQALQPFLVATSQHREMLKQALQPFALKPDLDLDVMTPEQSPTTVAAAVMHGIARLLRAHRPAWTIVQGDTTSALAAALASFYAQVPVAHVEAGLRSSNLHSPFPEEFNRRAISLATTLHFAPTRQAAANLGREGVASAKISMVGNTVVDALQRIRSGLGCLADDPGPPMVLMTLHRRESFGAPIRRVLAAVRRLVARRPGGVRVVYPVHPNPRVDRVAREMLSGLPEVRLEGPLAYPDFIRLFAQARFVMTDSGGIQEEAPALGVPVLVLRDVTERPELISSGWGRLVGTNEERILDQAELLLTSDQELETMKRGSNPFGDGNSAARIVSALVEHSAAGRAEEGMCC